MMGVLLNNLPYLIVLLAGIAVAIGKRRSHPRVASWGMACYGVLIVLWMMRMAQNGWVIWMHENGIGLEDHRTLLTALGYARMAVYYGVFLALVLGALRWRQEDGDPFQKPGIFIGVSIMLMIVGMVLARSLSRPSPWMWLLLICDLGSMISLMTAFYGWRGNEKVSVRSGSVTTAPSGTAGETPQKAPLTAGMFEEDDFIPYVLGVMILGGLVCIPVIWGQFNGVEYIKAVFPSLVSCGIFVYAHDKRGNFSFLKFFVGFFFVMMIVMRSMVQYGSGGGKPFFVAGGVVGYVVMLACGWAGIVLARSFRHKTGEKE